MNTSTKAGLLATLLVVVLAAPAQGEFAYLSGIHRSGGETDWIVDIQAEARDGKIVRIKTLEFQVKASCYYADGEYYGDPVIGPEKAFELRLRPGPDRRFSFDDTIQGWELDFDGRVSKRGKRIRGTLGVVRRDAGSTCVREPFEYESKRLV